MTFEYDVRVDADGTFIDSVRGQTVTLAIVKAIAELDGTDPLELEPVAEYIDTESLNGLCQASRTEGQYSSCRISFRYHGYDVTVYSPKTIEIRDATGGSRTPGRRNRPLFE